MSSSRLRFFLPLLLLAGCNHLPVSSLETPRYELSEPRHVIEPQRGSLYNSQATCLVCDHKGVAIGDIVTVVIAESSSATKEASTGTSRSSGMTAGMPNMLGAENVFSGLKSWLDLSKMISANTESSHNGSGNTSRKENLAATLAVRITQEVSPGQFAIRGSKHVQVNGEEQVLTLTGLVRGRDITSDNTISSGSVAEAQISYSGKGVISEQQNPGWLFRGLNAIWPF